VDRRLWSRNEVEDGHEDGGLRGPANCLLRLSVNVQIMAG
jgi:hypothetical protein